MAEEMRLFGMSAEKGRWVFVAIGLIVNLCLGTAYSWSVFKKPLEKLFSISATESGLPFMVFLAVFAIVMPIAGRFVGKYKIRTIAILGGIVVGAGWILSNFASNIYMLILTYGVVAGAGIGLIYGIPISMATKWFPDMKGLAVGLALVGFGMSPLITAPVARMLIESYGPIQTFGIMGVSFLAIIVLLSTFFKFPPAEWKPSGWNPVKTNADGSDMNVSGMTKKPAFYGLWICYVIGTLSGLMAIGISSPVGEEIVKLTPATAALTVSIFAIFNGAGRPLFGWLTDKITPRYSAILSFVIILAASIGMLYAGEGSVILYVLSFSGLWLSLGGWLAIAPTSTTTFFGVKNSTQNYGIVFTAYGAGAILGTLMSGQMRDIFGSYTSAFYPTAALAVIGMIVAWVLLRHPKA